MKNNLTCEQVSALITFYLQNNLSPKLKEYIKEHLESCPNCRKKFEQLENIYKKYNKENVSLNELESESDAISADVKSKLFEYIDNELTETESLKVKKMAITNPNTRKELENMYKLRKMLSSSYEKTKSNAKIDYSSWVSNQVQGRNDYSTTYFYKIAVVLVVIITSILGGFIYLYF